MTTSGIKVDLKLTYIQTSEWIHVDLMFGHLKNTIAWKSSLWLQRKLKNRVQNCN